MRILVGIWHPAHVHFFKNMIWNLQKDGHEVKIVARPKEMTLQLLDAYKFDYELCGAHKKNSLGKVLNAIEIERKLYRIVKEFKPDLLTGILDMYNAHVGRVLHRPSIIFTDSEQAKIVNKLTFPFASVICTPSCFKEDLGNKQVHYDGYHELAYLHTDYFGPDPSVLDDMNLSKNDRFFILRFVGWEASHDTGQLGFGIKEKREVVKKLEKHGRILITSERKLPTEFEEHRIWITPQRIQDLLYYATMLVTDGQTMATEAACLGTPAIRSNSFVGKNDMGNFIELEQEYGLIFNYKEPKKAIEKAIDIVQQPNLKQEWQMKREKLLKDKIKVTAFMTWFIENYPESLRIMKESPDYQGRFK